VDFKSGQVDFKSGQVDKKVDTFDAAELSVEDVAQLLGAHV
jgi:hypothetical protein